MLKARVFALVIVMIVAGAVARAAETSGAKGGPANASPAVSATSTAVTEAKAPAAAATPEREKLPQFAKASEALKAGRLDEALEAYKEAESMASSAAGKSNAANGMGFVCMKMRKPGEAVANLERAVQADPGNKVAWNNLGSCQLTLYESGQAGKTALDGALAAFEKVAAIDPAYKPENLKRAQDLSAREKAWAEAVAKRAAPAAPGANPNSAAPATAVPAGGTYQDLKATGEKAEKEGDFALAKANFEAAEKAASVKKGKSAAANMLGLLALKERDPKAAIENFRRSTTLDETNKYAWNNLGVALLNSYGSGLGGKEMVEEAAGAFRKVNELDPQYKPENLKWAEDLLAEAGGPEKPAETAPAAEAVPAAAPAQPAPAVTPTAPAKSAAPAKKPTAPAKPAAPTAGK
jgi:tetratricopeptide (TPR) repeat protein